MMKFTYLFLIIILGFSLIGEAQYFPLPDSLGGWRTLSDPGEIRKKTKIDIARLDKAIEYLKKDTKNGGLLVLRNGWLVYEKYFGKGHREATPNLASCGKSFTSIAFGILMSQHPELFPKGLDQLVFTPKYLPQRFFPLPDPMMSKIKLGQLLSFTAGIRGNNPVYVSGVPGTIDPVGPDGWYALVDEFALGLEEGKMGDIPFSVKKLWCEPGAGYSYATASIHIASIMLRHISGMELNDYLDKYLGTALGWGRWGFGYKNQKRVTHCPGGGGIALRATDMLRFGYLLLNEGKWEKQQIVPVDYVRASSHSSPYNPHYPYSLQFNVNTNGYWPDLPRDAYWKVGSGNHCMYIVPSLDLVVWKLGGRDGQYDPGDTGIPQNTTAKNNEEDRKGWVSNVPGDEAIIKSLEMVIESIVKK